MKYDHKKIEKKWQKIWEEKKLFAALDASPKPKYYCLIEFPYPSGDGLHVGHPRSYTALDILARKRRAQGYNVLYPIGFDAFGLPSENYAIKTGIHPAQTTKKNIATFTRQLKSFGFSFAWDRTIATTDPTYYKWTQWIFLKMYERGLAYKAKMPINWCPACKTGLANEEVINGKCERCGSDVTKKEIEQWLLRITRYADRLIDDLDSVDYLEKIKQQQINWIGRSEGAEIDFQIATSYKLQATSLKVFTTRPDTLFGATFMVVSPEHEIISNLQSQISNLKEVENYINQAKRKSDLERTDLTKAKTGVELKGIKAINPVNNKAIPIWVADYVLVSYGTGAIMAVPAHDQRDWDFAKKFNLPIVEVIAGGDVTKQAFEDTADGRLVNSGQFSELSVREAIIQIAKWLAVHDLGRSAVNYKLRDWVFSRQRYWGEPIPMVYCGNCKASGASNDGWIPVPEKDLPVELPQVKNYEPTNTGESPLAAITEWVNTACPRCDGPAKRETDTMPNWAGSNWYFLRYADPKNDDELADQDKLAYWLPVDWYNGGMEHTTLHLLYSRFVYKFLYDVGVIPKECGAEPYLKRTSHGLILGDGGEKMSKSRGNVVNPDDVIKAMGADTFRTYEMFMGPLEMVKPWSTRGVEGVSRFLARVWRLFMGESSVGDSPQKRGLSPLVVDREPAPEELRLLHQTIKKVTDDLEGMRFNTAISALMIFVNEMMKIKEQSKSILEMFVLLLSPFAPHLAEELWEKLGHDKTLAYEPWPSYDNKYLVENEVEIAIQVLGKIKTRLVVPVGISEAELQTRVMADANIKPWVEGKTVKKVIIVPGRLVNIIV